ncbi:unnamed protein product [Citrullus colocynthis]|uniref:Uncharacterized protein n=1 Tax=Citrullus colocynthis TaxID=252529 RepID=A0ABP0XY47_9ROSI
MIGVAATRRLADFTIPMELRIVGLEGPEPIRSQPVTPHLLGLQAPVFYRIQVLSKSSNVLSIKFSANFISSSLPDPILTPNLRKPNFRREGERQGIAKRRI